MNTSDHFISFKMIEGNQEQILGKLTFLKDSHELILYDKNFDLMFRDNLKKFTLEKKSISNNEIILEYDSKKIYIVKEKDLTSSKLFFLIQSSIMSLGKNSSKNNLHFNKYNLCWFIKNIFFVNFKILRN